MVGWLALYDNVLCMWMAFMSLDSIDTTFSLDMTQ